MQNKTIKEISNYIIDEMSDFFNTRVKDFVIVDMVNDINYKSFSIEFDAYDYFPMIFNYDMGRISFSICFGTKRMGLKNSQKWWDETDINILLNELKEEIEIRIPDKFLVSRGWL